MAVSPTHHSGRQLSLAGQDVRAIRVAVSKLGRVFARLTHPELPPVEPLRGENVRGHDAAVARELPHLP